MQQKNGLNGNQGECSKKRKKQALLFFWDFSGYGS